VIDGLVQTFERLVSMPMIARERTEFSPPVRIYVHGGYLVVYRLNGTVLDVIRVLGARQDWQAILGQADP
jgi:toxin ParE1/3/4